MIFNLNILDCEWGMVTYCILTQQWNHFERSGGFLSVLFFLSYWLNRDFIFHVHFVDRSPQFWGLFSHSLMHHFMMTNSSLGGLKFISTVIYCFLKSYVNILQKELCQNGNVNILKNINILLQLLKNCNWEWI